MKISLTEAYIHHSLTGTARYHKFVLCAFPNIKQRSSDRSSSRVDDARAIKLKPHRGRHILDRMFPPPQIAGSSSPWFLVCAAKPSTRIIVVIVVVVIFFCRARRDERRVLEARGSLLGFQSRYQTVEGLDIVERSATTLIVVPFEFRQIKMFVQRL